MVKRDSERRRRIESVRGASGAGATPDVSGDPDDAARRGPSAPSQVEIWKSAMVNSAVEQAIARGEFDDLPGLGKPLPGLDGRRDPDWWIKGKLADEDIRGVGPAALTLRQEAADLRGRLDAVDDEDEVRKLLEDFNRKVRDAGLDPHTGHLVATPMRRVEEEIAAWRSRRA